MTDPTKIGFLEDIIGVNFGGNGPFCVIWCDKFHTKGPTFTTNSALTVSSSSLLVPARGTIIQPTLLLPGQGAPTGSVPITDAVTAKMRSAYQSWIGTNKTFSDFSTPADIDQMGYMFFNMAKLKKHAGLAFNLAYSATLAAFAFEVCVVTYRKVNSVAYVHGPSEREGLTVVTPEGSDFVGDDGTGFFNPALAPRAIGFQGRSIGATLSKSWSVSVNPDSLAISMSA